MRTSSPAVARAWVLLALSIAVHVLDEALNGFLPIWNATMAALRLPTFGFALWLGGLVVGVLAMLAVAPVVRSGAAWTRKLAWFLGIVMVGNALGHTLGTIFGQTVGSVRFRRPMPGFYSSPLLLAAAVFLLWQLRRSRTAAS